MNPDISMFLLKIIEISSAFYPEKNGIFSPDQSFLLPYQNTTVQFAGNQKVLCGPSPYINTLNCFSTKFTHFIKSVPIPGDLSSTPVFIHDSWIIGTTKGFLFRVKTNSERDLTPSVAPETTEFWGSDSRKFMEDFVPKAIYQDGTSKKTVEEPKPQIPKGYLWIFSSSSPFIGTPVVKNDIVYALTASQLLQAIDFNTGKLIWSVKIAPNSPFYLKNMSLSIFENKVLIGTHRGRLLLLAAKTGEQINDVKIGALSENEDRFLNIVAAPLIIKHYAIVSNVSSITRKISLDSLETFWTYPEGSITTPLLLNEFNIILTTSTGKIVSLNEQTGSVNWISALNMNSPLVDTVFINHKKTLLIATKRGELIAIDSGNGKILVQNRPIGSVVGFFFKISESPDEACLSFSTGSFRCFKVKI